MPEYIKLTASLLKFKKSLKRGQHQNTNEILNHFQICQYSTYHCDYLIDYLSCYAELLEKSTSVSMETKKLHAMIYEIFKTLNNLNPVFMKDIFHYSPNVTHKKHNLYIHTQNTTKFGNKSLRAFGANI